MVDLEDPILYASKASNDPNTLYLLEALKAPDAAKFKKAMVKEVVDHTLGSHPKGRPPSWRNYSPSGLVHETQAPHRHEGDIYKWKAASPSAATR